MRSRKARLSSTDETFLAASAAESSVIGSSTTLLDNLGNEVKAPVHRRSDGLIKIAAVGLGYDVGTQALPEGQMTLQGMSHGLYAGGLDPAHLVHQGEHAVQALDHGGEFSGLDSQAGEPGEASDLVVG